MDLSIWGDEAFLLRSSRPGPAALQGPPDLEPVMIRGVAEVSDAGVGVAGFDGGPGGGVPDEGDVADLVGAEVAVPEQQVAGSLVAWRDAGSVAGGEPVALGGGDPG